MPFALVAAVVLSLIGIGNATAQNVAAFGRVVYPDGRPASGVRVELRNRSSAIALTTDARGVFRVQLEPRDLGTRVVVTALAAGWRFQRAFDLPRRVGRALDLGTGVLRETVVEPRRPAGGSDARPPVAGGGPTVCGAPKLWVLFLFNTGLNQDYLRGFGNGCWGFEAPDQRNALWRICNDDGSVNGRGRLWVYDETTPEKARRTDVQNVVGCSDRAGKTKGWVMMAPYVRPDGSALWRWFNQDEPAALRVQQYFIELYRKGVVMEEPMRRQWFNGYRQYFTPVVNAGAGDPSAALARICGETLTGWVGLWAGQPVIASRLSAIVQTLNSCSAAR